MDLSKYNPESLRGLALVFSGCMAIICLGAGSITFLKWFFHGGSK